MIHDLAVSEIHFCDLRHILITELEIPDVQVLFHTLLVNGFRDNGYTSLYVPAQSYLSRSLSVLLADSGQYRMSEDTMVAFCKRTPCLRMNAILFHKRQSVFLLEERMQLYLIDCRHNIYGLTQVRQTVRVEIADTDGFQFSFFISFLHRAVCSDIISHWLMDQIQVDVVHAQIFHGSFDGLLCSLIAGILYPQLGGNKQFLTWYTAFGDRRTHCLLVHISRSCVDQTVSAGNCIQNCLLTLCRIRYLEYTKALQRHLHTIVQFYCFNFAHCNFLLFSFSEFFTNNFLIRITFTQ